MLYHLLMAVGGVFVLLVGWVLVEQWVRRRAPNSPADCDIPEGAHGCAHCIMADTCTRRPPEGNDTP